MVWFKIDDGIGDHPKVRRLRRDKIEAMGVWVLCGTWSSRNLTDGFVPDDIVDTYDDQHRLAGRLVEVGLWERVKGEDEDGYQFHDWAQANPTKADVLASRAYNARKAALHRDPVLIQNVRARDLERCRYCGQLVNWRDRRSATGGTYDHVDPDGPNTLDNVVTACRACNSRKGGRTPREAGMRLLSPGAMGVSQAPRRPAIMAPNPPGSYLDTNQNGTSDDPDHTYNVESPRPDPTRTNRSTSRGGSVDLVTDRGRTAKSASTNGSSATFETIMTEWRTAGKRSKQLDAATAGQVRSFFAQQFRPADIRNAVQRWSAKGNLGAGALPSFLDEVVNGSKTNGAAPSRGALSSDPDAAFAALLEHGDALTASRLITESWAEPTQHPADTTPMREWLHAQRCAYITDHEPAIRAALTKRVGR